MRGVELKPAWLDANDMGFGDELDRINDHRRETRVADAAMCSTALEIYNYSGLDVTVVFRDGVRVTYCPLGKAPTPEIADHILFIRKIGIPKTGNVTESRAGTMCARSRIITSAIERAKEDPRVIGNKMAEYYDLLAVQAIHSSENSSLYLNTFDIVLSTMPNDMAPNHPYSDQGSDDRAHYCDKEVTVNDGSAIFKVRVIDNSNSYSNHWVNINGTVMRVEKSIDRYEPDGVYITTRGIVGDGSERSMLKTERLTMAEAREEGQPFRLYGTYGDARDLGDPEYMAIREKRKLEKEKQEHELDRRQFDESLESIKRESEQLRAENIRLKHESEKRGYEYEQRNTESKYYYEERSRQRKDSSEFIKWVPTLIIGTISLVTLVVATINKGTGK